jgi:myo-inositol-1(or 4)-monophosphatase
LSAGGDDAGLAGDLARACRIAAEAAVASADLLRAGPGSAHRRLEGRDIKLNEDSASEALIVAALRARSALPIFSEECGWVDGVRPASPDAPYWAVDPLDGSFNFLRGIPLSCTSVAFCTGLEAHAGAVFDFNRDELFTGGPTLGLQCNGEHIAVDARCYDVLATGFPVRGGYSEADIAAVAQEFGGWRKIRMLGSAALSLTWVALGRIDGYGEDGISWYDVAGGLALVAGAGGSVSVLGEGIEQPLKIAARSAAYRQRAEGASAG